MRTYSKVGPFSHSDPDLLCPFAGHEKLLSAEGREGNSITRPRLKFTARAHATEAGS